MSAMNIEGVYLEEESRLNYEVRKPQRLAVDELRVSMAKFAFVGSEFPCGAYSAEVSVDRVVSSGVGRGALMAMRFATPDHGLIDATVYAHMNKKSIVRPVGSDDDFFSVNGIDIDQGYLYESRDPVLSDDNLLMMLKRRFRLDLDNANLVNAGLVNFDELYEKPRAA